MSATPSPPAPFDESENAPIFVELTKSNTSLEAANNNDDQYPASSYVAFPDGDSRNSGAEDGDGDNDEDPGKRLSPCFL